MSIKVKIEEKTVKIKIYITSDGDRFDNKHDAEMHEVAIEYDKIPTFSINEASCFYFIKNQEVLDLIEIHNEENEGCTVNTRGVADTFPCVIKWDYENDEITDINSEIDKYRELIEFYDEVMK